MLDHISKTSFSLAGIILEILSLYFVLFSNLHTKNSVEPDPKYIYTASNLNPNPSYNDHTPSKPKILYDYARINIHYLSSSSLASPETE